MLTFASSRVTQRSAKYTCGQATTEFPPRPAVEADPPRQPSALSALNPGRPASGRPAPSAWSTGIPEDRLARVVRLAEDGVEVRVPELDRRRQRLLGPGPQFRRVAVSGEHFAKGLRVLFLQIAHRFVIGVTRSVMLEEFIAPLRNSVR